MTSLAVAVYNGILLPKKTIPARSKPESASTPSAARRSSYASPDLRTAPGGRPVRCETHMSAPVAAFRSGAAQRRFSGCPHRAGGTAELWPPARPRQCDANERSFSLMDADTRMNATWGALAPKRKTMLKDMRHPFDLCQDQSIDADSRCFVSLPAWATARVR